MSTIEEVTALFENRVAEMLPITGKPTKANFERLRELLSNLPQTVEPPGGINAEGLITTEAN